MVNLEFGNTISSQFIAREHTSYHDRNTAIKKPKTPAPAYKRGLSAPPPQSNFLLCGSMTFLPLLLLLTLSTSLAVADPLKGFPQWSWTLGGSPSTSCGNLCTSDNDCNVGADCNTCNTKTFNGFIIRVVKGTCG